MSAAYRHEHEKEMAPLIKRHLFTTTRATAMVLARARHRARGKSSVDPRPQVRGPCFNGREILTRERERVRGSRVAREKKGEKQMSEKGRRAPGRSEEGTDTRRRKEIRQEGIDGVGA